MPNCTSINIVLELFAVSILVVLLASCLLRHRQGSSSGLFIATLAVLLVATLGDVAAWMFADSAVPAALAMTTAGNAACYLFGAVGYTLYAFLTFRQVGDARRPQTVVGKAVLACVGALGAANVVLFLANFQTGWLYTLDSQNTFTWGPYRLAPDLILLAQLVAVLVALLAERGRALNDTLAGWALQGLVPVLMVLVECAFPSLMLVCPALAVVLLPVHIWEQHTHEMWLAERERELALARAEALAGQIKPHFIANSLLAIQQMVGKDPARGRKLMQQFSLYLRDNYELVGKNGLSPFPIELEHARYYVAIEQVDPTSRVRLECDLGPTGFEIPSLSLQPLVENAVRHGVGPKPDGGCVTVSTAEGPDEWVVTVADDGVGFAEGAVEGVGLGNVRSRLDLLCGGTLDVQSGPAGTRVSMHIPKASGASATGLSKARRKVKEPAGGARRGRVPHPGQEGCAE